MEMIFFWYVVLFAQEDFQKVSVGLESIYTVVFLVQVAELALCDILLF